MHLEPSWRLGFALPLLIILTFFTDVTLRFVPADRLASGGWSAARRFRQADGSLQPNKRYVNERTYGELAFLGNLPALRQYRRQAFTTDAFGYRNAPGLAQERPIDAILVGSSMSTGLGNSDEHTLSAQLSALAGRPVYNASLITELHSLARIRQVAQRLEMRRGLVIFEYMERFDLPEAQDTGRPHICFRVLRLAGGTGLDGVCSWLRGTIDVSPLRLLAERAYKTLQRDVVFPNVHASNVVQRRLRNAETMAFFPQDLEKFYQSRAEERAVEYLAWLAAELQIDNLDLLVVLVPHKYTVYHPLLQEPDPPRPEAIPYLYRVETGLLAAGVPAVNVSDPLIKQAASDLERGEYVYWRDDGHWNPRGIALVASEIRRTWDELSR